LQGRNSHIRNFWEAKLSQSYSSDDIKTLFTFPFEDPEWVNKFLIGSLVAFSAFIIPLLPYFLLYGYMAEVMRRAINHNELSLPAWDDWGKLFTDGLKLFGAIFVWMLPVMLLFFVGFFVFFFGLGLAGATTEGSESAAAALSIGGMIGMFIFFGLMTLFGMAIGFLFPVVMGHVVATNEFGAAFRIREWWAIFRANLGGFLMAFVLLFALSMALSFALSLLYFTIILCCIIPFLMAPVTLYLVVIQGAVFGQAYRQGRLNVG
jgi:hypothetical protein